jgi:RNA polymerase sigma-70 factor (ECF subfamily)
MDGTSTNEELLQRFLQIRAVILGYLRVLVRDPFLAEDLFQETYLVVSKKLDTFDRSGNFDAWVRGIARNLANNARRKQSRLAPLPSPELVEAIDSCYDSTPEGENDEFAHCMGFLHTCLERLAEPQRRMLSLRYGADKSLREVAAEFGRTAGAVQVALSRLRSFLLDCVQNKERVTDVQ